MPATTRSKTTQTRLDDFANDDEVTTKGLENRTAKEANNASSASSKAGRSKNSLETGAEKPSKTKKSSTARKRKGVTKNVGGVSSEEEHQPSTTTTGLPAKKQRQQKKISASSDITPGSIVINRAPVLQLWGASVARFLHPDVAWTTCLGIGSQIATLCAISKGRRIGAIEPADADKKAEKKRKTAEGAEGADEDLEVMGFAMHVKDGEVVVQGKPKKANEAQLKGKFGDEGYEAAKLAMAEALKSWKGEEDELDKKAFAMYEHFRPSVQSGQAGWGRKGELSLEKIHESVHRNS
ncbi:uncharacterized protein A1O9_10820 [Exophiala aquamarina CBS 119918]|uniref:Uncharacterized protein n=1 Tax=Exophiala aquamarina CBS 119918 TaxID=1182545 RepID=A0A072NYH4_9EURO|nr:uncharacterized protein A1O9_10820 [Exophiala aquamarina CBS 119918]KEF52914.1 hypothetical protein A1O9_10820 [Exophiala aquamarina CBS 119918]